MEILVTLAFIVLWVFHSQIEKQGERIDELEDKLKQITGEVKEYDEFGPTDDE